MKTEENNSQKSTQETTVTTNQVKQEESDMKAQMNMENGTTVMTGGRSRGNDMIHPQVPKRISLAGTTFNKPNDNTQHNIDMLTLGGYEPFELLREPDNPYDLNAIRVAVVDGKDTEEVQEFHVGYIPKDYNVYLAPMMDKGRKFQTCNHQRKQHPYHKTLGISIEIREVSDMQKIVFK